jgi:hypothetical protein
MLGSPHTRMPLPCAKAPARTHDTPPHLAPTHLTSQQVYPEPLRSFASDAVPAPVVTVPVMERGRAALEAINKARCACRAAPAVLCPPRWACRAGPARLPSAGRPPAAARRCTGSRLQPAPAPQPATAALPPIPSSPSFVSPVFLLPASGDGAGF